MFGLDRTRLTYRFNDDDAVVCGKPFPEAAIRFEEFDNGKRPPNYNNHYTGIIMCCEVSDTDP